MIAVCQIFLDINILKKIDTMCFELFVTTVTELKSAYVVSSRIEFLPVFICFPRLEKNVNMIDKYIQSKMCNWEIISYKPILDSYFVSNQGLDDTYFSTGVY